jgi:hypothetical protein
MRGALGVFIVQPNLQGGWRLSNADTGEVIDFQSGGQAERLAMALARQAYATQGAGEVWVYDRLNRLVGRWRVAAGSLGLIEADETAKAA